ncbi:MAG: threonine-phosphate decarboxylase [Gammaproteobacteria bacterium]|nr:threonine-phosphate decarboxylase [Gammaproteobacteria bacterium]
MAAARYNISLDEWLDLSTGINPDNWQGATAPITSWSRLPENEDGLREAACAYYGVTDLLPVAGSQAAIQILPNVYQKSRVAVLTPSYNEHAHAWRRAGHQVDLIDEYQLESAIDSHNTVVVVNPNNPTGLCFSPETLLHWHERLVARGGCLLVDEAFMDATPNNSLAPYAHRKGLIVLRSLGKFFGLAGARVGFVLAEKYFLKKLAEALGPWTISGPSRWIATQALCDQDWQMVMRQQLKSNAIRLSQQLTDYGLSPDGGSALFQFIVTPQAQVIHTYLAQQGILTRLFNNPYPSSLRFGLPGTELEWQRLQQALADLSLSPVLEQSA